jgi:peptidoglycan/LPS O-acetylase OafA/YrhL
MSAKSDHDGIVDVWRGIAALLVAYLHCRQFFWVGIREHHASAPDLSITSVLAYVSFPIVFGSIGVAIFFVISGYCIHRAHAGALVVNPGYSLNVGAYLVRRAIRIYPPLVLGLVLTWLFDTLTIRMDPRHAEIADLSASTFFINLFALQGVLGPWFGSNGPLWSLAIEMQIYVFYPVFFALRKRYGVTALFIAALVMNALSLVLTHKVGIKIFPSYILVWVLGALLAEPLVIKLFGHKTTRFLIGWGIVVVALGCGVYFADHDAAFHVWGVGYALVLLAQLRQRPTSLLASAAAFVGNFSYSLYILHVPFFYFVATALGLKSHPNIFVSLLMLLIGVLFSFVCYWLVERPVVRALNASRASGRVSFSRETRERIPATVSYNEVAGDSLPLIPQPDRRAK